MNELVPSGDENGAEEDLGPRVEPEKLFFTPTTGVIFRTINYEDDIEDVALDLIKTGGEYNRRTKCVKKQKMSENKKQKSKMEVSSPSDNSWR